MARSPAVVSEDQRAALKAMDGKRPVVKIKIGVINRGLQRRLITPGYFKPVRNIRQLYDYIVDIYCIFYSFDARIHFKT